MKGVIYARYSSTNQTENSIEGQLREYKTFAEGKRITVMGSYIERALSACHKTASGGLVANIFQAD